MVLRILTLLLVVTSGVFALSLQEAKSSGQVCESGNGYVQAVDGSAEVRALVNTTNEKRRQKYTEIASKNGTPVDAVAAEAAASLGSTCN